MPYLPGPHESGRLPALPELRYLNLSGSGYQAVDSLVGFPRLRNLIVDRRESLSFPFESLPRLERLQFVATSFEEEDLRRFRLERSEVSLVVGFRGQLLEVMLSATSIEVHRKQYRPERVWLDEMIYETKDKTEIDQFLDLLHFQERYRRDLRLRIGDLHWVEFRDERGVVLGRMKLVGRGDGGVEVMHESGEIIRYTVLGNVSWARCFELWAVQAPVDTECSGAIRAWLVKRGAIPSRLRE